ncbi:MAG: SDR family oxidoreductase [Ardenticatenaceae bacterium]|nr:SDR family oxidoreductase [Ardenticatenaceae bacterium]MCB9446131.1 SDR family oxidoreductase [Ardenticatenaceae bacterium]
MNQSANHLPLAGQVAIVTGAGRGIGAAVAQLLAASGTKVAINDINPDRAERTAAAIRAEGGEAAAIVADISNKFQCSHLVDSTRREWGRLDILINNAAIKPSSSILKTDEFEWQRVMDVNLKGTFFMSQLVGRVMADENQARGGVIINVGSKAGVIEPLVNHAAYAASKAGVVGFTRECAREFANYGIRVHAVTPDEPADAATVAQTILSLCTNPDSPLIV